MSDLYEMISYIITYSAQYLAIILVLYREKGSNKEFLIHTLYVSVPFLLFCLATGLMVVFDIQPTSAITLVGPGVLFSDLLLKRILST